MKSGLGAVKADEVPASSIEETLICKTCQEDDAAVFGVGDQGEDELVADDEGEQAEEVRPLPTPHQLTLSEYRDHCVTHFPYHSGCPHCQEGRGREFGHRRREKGPGEAPIVSFDYAFLSDKEDITDQAGFEAAGEGAVKVLVVRDDKSKSVFGHVIPRKGLDEKGFSVDCLVEDIKWLGYSKVVLKSDNEPAIIKLLSEALENCESADCQKFLKNIPLNTIPSRTAAQKLE